VGEIDGTIQCGTWCRSDAAAFEARIHLLRERHARKPSFLDRLRKTIG
jgi:hypothetical protein